MTNIISFEQHERISKSDAAAITFGAQTMDYALPQAFLNRCYERGFDDAASNLVMLYPSDTDQLPHVAPVTERGIYILSVLATFA